jgi:hypothetical protein
MTTPHQSPADYALAVAIGLALAVLLFVGLSS